MTSGSAANIAPETLVAVTATTALLSAVLAAGITYLISRRNLKKDISLKMAEFRIDWINKLSGEMSNVFSYSTIYNLLVIENEGGLSPEQERLKLEYFGEIVKSRTQIELLLRESDPKYQELQVGMTAFLNAFRKEEGRLRSEDVVAARVALTSLCNAILKEEWRRTKANLAEDTVEVAALRSTRVNFMRPEALS